jgi:hypothetical protein
MKLRAKIDPQLPLHAPFAIFQHISPEGEMGKTPGTPYPSFEFRIQPDFVTMLFMNPDNKVMTFFESLIIKEAAGLQFLADHPDTFKCLVFLETTLSGLIGSTLLGSTAPRLTQEQARNPMIREAIWHLLGLWNSYEGAGYLEQVRFLKGASFSPEDAARLAHAFGRSPVAGVFSSTLDYLRNVDLAAASSFWRIAQYHIANLMRSEVSAATERQARVVRLAIAIEASDGHLPLTADGRARLLYDPVTHLPAPMLFQFLNNRHYSNAVLGLLQQEFGSAKPLRGSLKPHSKSLEVAA